MNIREIKEKYEPIEGRWYINRELGSGSFGTVFEVERRDFGEIKAAMKVISIPNSESEYRTYREENYDLDEPSITAYYYGFVEEFVKEFQLMSKLKGHTNIVGYEDHSVVERKDSFGWDIFIRMELLTPMSAYFRANKPTRKSIIKLGIDICKALEVCQQYKIIHRDIKPSNIFVSETGDFKLGDFGVARTFEKTSSELSKKGTYTYMAPEVFRGAEYGANVDLYSLGIVMYKLLNNNMEPFKTSRGFAAGSEALEKRMKDEPMAPPANATGRLAGIVLKACSFDPKERYKTPQEMREELESVMFSEENLPVEGTGEVDYDPSTIGRGREETEKPSDSSEEGGTVSVFGDDKTNGRTIGIFGKTEQVEDEMIGTEKEDKEPAEKIEGGTEPSNLESEIQPPKSKKKPILWIVLAAAAVLLLIFLLIPKDSGYEDPIVNPDTYPEEETVEPVVIPENTEPSAEEIQQRQTIANGFAESKNYVNTAAANTAINQNSIASQLQAIRAIFDRYDQAVADSATELVTLKNLNSERHVAMEALMSAYNNAVAAANKAASTAATKKPTTTKSTKSTKSTAQTKCSICGSTAHTSANHPTCSICGSTSHVASGHPRCATCGSTAHTTHPEERPPDIDYFE